MDGFLNVISSKMLGIDIQKPFVQTCEPKPPPAHSYGTAIQVRGIW